MNKAVSVFLILSLAIAVIIVFISSSAFPNQQKNGFSRRFIPVTMIEKENLALKGEQAGIAGFDNTHIYLFGDSAGVLLQLRLDFSDPVRINIPVASFQSGHPVCFPVIRFPEALLFFPNDAMVLTYNLENKRLAKDSLKINFLRAVPLSSVSFILRIIDNDQNKALFKKINLASREILTEQNLSPGADEGGFATDGMLHYDSIQSRFYYLNYYNNQFRCIDSNLKRIYTSHTIDTVFHSQVHTVRQINNGAILYTFDLAPTITNGQSQIANEYLYVRSNLMADNETSEMFNNHWAMDRYQLSDGSYAGSFYIPRYKGQKSPDFAFHNNELYILYTGRIICYGVKF